MEQKEEKAIRESVRWAYEARNNVSGNDPPQKKITEKWQMIVLGKLCVMSNIRLKYILSIKSVPYLSLTPPL